MASTDNKALVIHDHCSTCIRMNCVIKPDDITSCGLTYCASGCGSRFHSCKSGDHKTVCQKEKISCINKLYGCPLEIVRENISQHLPVCPASVILCSKEWNRWPMYSKEQGWKAPMPFKNPHVKCGQFDVAFAMRDQQMLMDSFMTPKKTRKILRNPLSLYYPAVPIQSYSSTIDSPTSEASLLSDDDSGTPWDLTDIPAGLQQAISNKLSSNNQSKLYAASKQAAESLTKTLDYVTGRQGLKRLSEIARKQDEIRKQEQERVEAEILSEKLLSNSINETVVPSTSKSATDDLTGSSSTEDDELDIYCQEKKLFEVLGVDLCMSFISSYQAKPPKMFTFLCGQEFRRDEYLWHVQNYHTDIQCNLNNWFEQRCPLAYAGCTFSFQRFKPKTPSGAIVHSPVLHTFGLSPDNEFVADLDHVNYVLTEEEDVRTSNGRKRLREATPEIHTSYRYDGLVHVIPRYKSESRENSPVKHTCSYNLDEHQLLLTNLPFEILQSVVRHLDSFSIKHMSMTCKLLQSVCCSLLEERGLVSLVWEKTRTNETLKESYKWKVAYKRWQFSKGFCPVTDWQMTEESSSAVHEHLKICPYNQDADKNIKQEAHQMITPFPICPSARTAEIR